MLRYIKRKWQPTPVFLPGKSHGQRGLVGYSPWGCKELDMTEQLYFTTPAQGFPASSDDKESACSAKDLGLTPGLGRSAGEGNGTPLQYSCLENPMDKEHVKLATKTHTHWFVGCCVFRASCGAWQRESPVRGFGLFWELSCEAVTVEVMESLVIGSILKLFNTPMVRRNSSHVLSS